MLSLLSDGSFSRDGKRKLIPPFKSQIKIVPDGWQFFPSLTNGDPPGTIFRITPQKQMFHVGETKNVPIYPSIDAQGKKTEKIEASTDMLVKILGLNLNAGSTASQNEDLVFEMNDSLREITNDLDIDPLIEKTFNDVKIRKEDRYFVIRETTATKQITFELKKDQVDRLGGEAKIQEKIEAKATVFSKKDSTTFEMKRKFDELMRVMFNAEEIHVKPDAQFKGLSLPSSKVPEFIRSPLKERLEWIDAQ